MKRYLRHFFYNFLALIFTGYLLAGVKFVGGYQTILLATLALTLVNLLVSPLVKLLLLPINLLTMGAFRWLINLIALYLVTVIVPQFQIKSFTFTGFTYQGFVVPTVNLSVFWAFLATSLVLSLSTTFLIWLNKS